MASYYAGAGDGYVMKQDVTNWDTAHDAVEGSTLSYTSPTTARSLGCRNSSGTVFQINRDFFPIDSSGIGDTDIIINSTFYVAFAGVYNEDNDGDDWLNVVQTSQASPTALALGDFDQCGAIDNPTEGSTRFDYSDIKWATYTTQEDNGSGFVRVTSNTVHTLEVGDYVYMTNTITPSEYRGWHTVTNVTDNTHYDLDVAYVNAPASVGYALTYTTFSLNSIGKSWIKKTAADPYTMLGLREGHDCIDSAIAGTTNGNTLFAYFSEGTNLDAYLDVEVIQIYVIFQFKDYSPVGDEQGFNVTWNGQTSLAPSVSPVVLQIYNFDTSLWEDVVTNNTADANTDFTLTTWIGDSGEDVSAYHDANDMICCRVYQGG